MNSGLGRAMRSGDVALRLSAVVAMAGFIVMAAGIHEIDGPQFSVKKAARPDGCCAASCRRVRDKAPPRPLHD
jgi:hypothetical protein